jgi:hypothetical protein
LFKSGTITARRDRIPIGLQPVVGHEGPEGPVEQVEHEEHEGEQVEEQRVDGRHLNEEKNFSFSTSRTKLLIFKIL